MKLATLSFLVCSLILNALLANDAKWSYKGENSPENWGRIAQEFSTCQTGKNQSPINITSYLKVKNPEKITFHYGQDIKSEINNGHTIQVNFNTGTQNYIKIGNQEYELLQFHFHAPAEFRINDKQYPLAMHLVHQDKNKQLVVVGIEFKIGKENKILAPIWEAMPEKSGETSYPKKIALQDLIPKKTYFYHFNGSLTTPPCTEGVTWIVLKKPLEISKAQLEKFKKIIGGTNNRPLQPSNNRVIIEE
ncbi:hypothetical protein BKH41_02470 [Helicobacter sp. 12S02232-10]|uniref:carbonic anhydrase n=1 Tax=Helicobacter sp. 12S02232-10 TaxID=1476197 RepID=UPI000BA52212|nr:carbonic anhydrase family protein [Helicobacter sp. 12S02232-10]PAF49547.1 hypothetical protein BKH41_02470 [Helicobacter sp. 12S02232-10]